MLVGISARQVSYKGSKKKGTRGDMLNVRRVQFKRTFLTKDEDFLYVDFHNSPCICNCFELTLNIRQQRWHFYGKYMHSVKRLHKKNRNKGEGFYERKILSLYNSCLFM